MKWVKWSDVEWTDVICVKWFYFKVKWNEWSEVMWSELTWYVWSDFILKWSWMSEVSEVKWVTSKFLGTKLPCTLGLPCTEDTWLCCDYFIWCVSCTVVVLSNIWACVFVGFVMCGCFDNYVGVLVICVLSFTTFLYCFVYVYLFLFVTSVRITATEWELNCSKQ